MKSKINQLLPIVSISDKLESSWKLIKRTIFDLVVLKATMSRESAAILKLSYYDIIIRPILKMVEKIEYGDETTELSSYINNISLTLFSLNKFSNSIYFIKYICKLIFNYLHL